MKPGRPKETVRLWLSGALAALLFAAMAIHAAPLSPSIPVIQFTYNESAFKAVLAQWGPEGVERFRSHFFIDFPFLASYGVFGYLLARHGRLPDKLTKSAQFFLTWALPAAAALDVCEDLLHLSFIADGASPMAGAYLLAGLVATGKWGLIAAFVIGFFYARRR
jgi:hypothetical protein